MPTKKKSRLATPSIFQRLKNRGIGWQEYSRIKKILLFDVPQSIIFFENHFPNRSGPSVLRQIKKWQQLLRHDFVLFANQRQALEVALDGAKMFAWQALVDASFIRLGSWILSKEFVRKTATTSSGALYAIRIVAENCVTGEQRTAMLPSQKATGKGSGETWEKLFAELGLLQAVMKEPRARRLTSSERPQAWPIFTQIVIPALYDSLIPYYPAQGHVSNKEKVFHRKAHYPRPLLEDLIAILREQYPAEFRDTTPAQLKALIQRHLYRKDTKTQKMT